MAAFNPANPYHAKLLRHAVWSSWWNLTPIMSNVERVFRESCIGIVDYPKLVELAQDVVNAAARGER